MNTRRQQRHRKPRRNWFGIAVFVFLLGFIGMKILVPPAETVQRLELAGREYRVQKIFYSSDPFIRVQTRSGLLWRTLYNGTPQETNRIESAKLESVGDVLLLRVNGQPVWEK